MQSLKHDLKLFIAAHTADATQSTFLADGRITPLEFLTAGICFRFSDSHQLFQLKASDINAHPGHGIFLKLTLHYFYHSV